MFGKSLVKIATCVHHTWLSMRRTCSVKCDWNVTLEWTLNVQENILSTFCFSLQFLYWDKTLRVCFLSSFFPKFWRGQIVPLTVFLRDNFKCSVGLAQWRGLAQTGLSWCTSTKGNCYCFHILTWSCDAFVNVSILCVHTTIQPLKPCSEQYWAYWLTAGIKKALLNLKQFRYLIESLYKFSNNRYPHPWFTENK